MCSVCNGTSSIVVFIIVLIGTLIVCYLFWSLPSDSTSNVSQALKKEESGVKKFEV